MGIGREDMKHKAESLRIALPSSTFLPALGGIEIGLHAIARRLKARGHTPLIIAPASHIRKIRHASWHLPYKLCSLPPKIMMLAQYWPATATRSLALFFSLLHWRFDIHIWHGTMGYPVGVALARASCYLSDAVLLRCAGQDIQVDINLGYGMRLNRQVDTLIQYWLPRLPALVAVSETIAQDYRALSIPESRIHNIPNGVNIARFQTPCPAAKTLRAKFGEKCFIFLAVGRNHPKKDFATLIAATALLAKRNSTLNFLTVIAGREVNKLLPLIHELHILHRIALHELSPPREEDVIDKDLPTDELLAFYHMADSFVMPSTIEAFGIVIIEAMAAGLPVITSDAPGCRDVARPGQDSVGFSTGSAEALSDAMNSLAVCPEQQAHWAERSRLRARDFDWEYITDQLRIALSPSPQRSRHDTLIIVLYSRNPYRKNNRDLLAG